MVRAILGVIVGYVVMAVFVVATFGIMMAALGPEGVFQPGTYWTTRTFNIVVLAGGTVGAIVGGLVCTLIARSQRPVMVLAGLVLAYGLVAAVLNMNKPDPAPPTGTPTFEEVRTRGKEPNWFAFSTAILGAGGLLIGGKLKRQPAPSAA